MESLQPCTCTRVHVHPTQVQLTQYLKHVSWDRVLLRADLFSKFLEPLHEDLPHTRLEPGRMRRYRFTCRFTCKCTNKGCAVRPTLSGTLKS